MSTVLQPWVEKMPWKQQSILFSGLRGPDNQAAKYVKAVCRWMRSVSQNNADPSKDYMRKDPLPSFEQLDLELENLTVHFVHHFADALRVIAIWHPDAVVAAYASGIHQDVAGELFHFHPESVKEFDDRHRDKVEHP